MSELLNSTEINIINSNGFEGVLNDTLKSRAFSILDTIQFPTTRTEAWKYTRLGKISNKKFNIQKGKVADISKFEISKEATTIVFINGFIDSSLSSKEIPSGIEFKSIANSTIDFGKNVKLENEIFHSINNL